jgi:hypothetical protein
LPTTPALRREEIKLQVALIPALLHVKGYAAPETKEAVERARLLIEQAEALGEPPEDPVLLYLILYGVWIANYIAFNGDVGSPGSRSYRMDGRLEQSRLTIFVKIRSVPKATSV